MSGLPLLRPLPSPCEGRRLNSSYRRRRHNLAALAAPASCSKSSNDFFASLSSREQRCSPVQAASKDASMRRPHFPVSQSSVRFSVRRDALICRVQSIEGTEKSSAADSALEQQRDREDEAENGGGAGNMQSEDEQKATTGSRGENGNASVTARDESFASARPDTAAETTPAEKLRDYGSGQDWDEEVQYVTRISVPRQKYIPVPKVDLVNALLLFFFPGNKDPSKFLSICSSLELILHTKLKVQLEELRSDYSLMHSVNAGEMQESSNFLRVTGATNASKLGDASEERSEKQGIIGELADWPIDSPAVEGSSSREGKVRPLKVLKDVKTKLTSIMPHQNEDKEPLDAFEDDSPGPSSEAEARIQLINRSRIRNVTPELLYEENLHIKVAFVAHVFTSQRGGRGAISEELSKAAATCGIRRDISSRLTAAFNPDYLLALPVDVDWKQTSASNVKIFRRGYTKEEQKGLLLGAKFDYLQSLIVRKTFKWLTGPMLSAGDWFSHAWRSIWGKNGKGNEKDSGDNMDSGDLAESVSRWLQEPLHQDKEEEPLNSIGEPPDEEKMLQDRKAQLDMPIWLAARQAIPRYEAVLSSAGSRGKLVSRILLQMGLVQEDPPPLKLSSDSDEKNLEPHLRPTHLSRVSMDNIWQPASESVVGGNIFRKISTAFSLFVSQATLHEPSFKELVLIYKGDSEEDSERTGLRLQTYQRIPLSELKIVFPTKKLIYRVLDTLRLDITSIAGLLAFLVNYHFDDIRSSPSAFVLDIIAGSALVVFLARAAFGYKQVFDQYQVIINKTLYEKTLARGFGVVQYLLDATEEQLFKGAILAYLVLVQHGNSKGMTKSELADECERFLYYKCKEQVEMPVENAVKTLVEFGLLAGAAEGGKSPADSRDGRLKAVSYDEGLRALERHWSSQLSTMSLWNRETVHDPAN